MPNPFLYIKTVLFQTIQFCISTQFSFIWPIDRTLSTTSGQSGAGNDGNEGVVCFHPNSSITGALSAGLMSYPGHSLGWGSYPYAEIQSMYSTAPADWASWLFAKFCLIWHKTPREEHRLSTLVVVVETNLLTRVSRWSFLYFGLFWFGFFVEWHINHRGFI